MLQELFEHCCDKIETANQQLEHTLGWRFLVVPKANFIERPDVALITLQPGGRVDDPRHPRESSERGPAYIVEEWKGFERGGAPLQIQFRTLFNELGTRLGTDEPDALLRASLAAYFIPFRSPTWKDFPHQRESAAFSTQLWKEILEQVHPKIIITIDTFTFTKLLQVAPGQPDRAREFPTGWGNYNASVVTLSSGAVLCRFPHLSRFSIFNRPKSREQVAAILDAVVEKVR